MVAPVVADTAVTLIGPFKVRLEGLTVSGATAKFTGQLLVIPIAPVV